MRQTPSSSDFTSRRGARGAALRGALLCALSLTALLSSLGCAAHARSLSSSQVSLEVLDGDGYALPSFASRGQTYVMGEHGQRYKLRVVNRTGGRVEAVVTVDGRDVVNGALGSYSNRGYVLDAYESVTIEGFRRSESEVATFRFTAPGDSYAGRMGSAGNVGVIGLAVFTERPRPRPRPAPRHRVAEEEASRSAPASAPEPERALDEEIPTGGGGMLGFGDGAGSGRAAPAAAAPSRSMNSRGPAPKSDLGTRYGESRSSQVEEVVFRRASDSPSLVRALQYDSEEGLRHRGVLPPSYPERPSAFPNERRYAPPPP